VGAWAAKGGTATGAPAGAGGRQVGRVGRAEVGRLVEDPHALGEQRERAFQLRLVR